MGNSRSFTSKFVANKEAFERLLKRGKCTSLSKRKAAMERAATLPNRLPPIRPPSLKKAQEEGRK